jgi:hypothetical protein
MRFVGSELIDVLHLSLAGDERNKVRFTFLAKPKLAAVADFIDKVLDEDRRAPHKQHDPARRIHRRILRQCPDSAVAESRRCNHVRERSWAEEARSIGMRPGSTWAMSRPRCRCLQCARWRAGRRSTCACHAAGLPGRVRRQLLPRY